jgi:exonuclease III
MEGFLNKELILFYNVENLFSPDPKPKHKLDPTISGFRNWDEKKYQNKLHKIAHVFRLIEEQEKVLPMIIGLAEVYGEENLKDLVKLEPFKENFGIVHYDSLDERGVDTALLYDKRKLELLHSEPISFVFENEPNSRENFDTTRDVLFCKLKYNDEIINVFVMHLPSKREKDINGPKRDFIIDSIRNRVVKLYKDSEEAMVVCGDFNENPTEENLSRFLYDEEGVQMLNNPGIELYHNRIFSTFHHKEGLLFDQILLSKHFFHSAFSLNYEKAIVFNSEKISVWHNKYKGRPYRTYAGTRYLGGYSDHYPVLVRLKNNM